MRPTYAKKHIQHPEHDEQAAFFQLMAILANKGNVPAASTFAVPNGAHFATQRHGAIMKEEGLKAGVPDILVAYANHGYHGMAIEMKVPPNKVTAVQLAWHMRLRANGWKVVVAATSEEAFNEWVLYVPECEEVRDLVEAISWETPQ